MVLVADETGPTTYDANYLCPAGCSAPTLMTAYGTALEAVVDPFEQ